MNSPQSPTNDLQLEILLERPRLSHEDDKLEGRIDIVAVPGVGDVAAQPWNHGQVNWLKDEEMLPYWLPTARFMSVSYDWPSGSGSQYKSFQHQLALLARVLLRAVMTRRQDCSSRPLIFVGHSFGGLIIKKAALICELYPDEYPGFARSLAGVIFLGTPHRGSSKHVKSLSAIVASVAKPIDCDGTEFQGVIAEEEEVALLDLSWEFARLAVVQHIPLYSFIETPSQGKPLVDEQSGSIANFPTATLMTDQFNLSKFANPDDPNYILVRDQLITFTHGAASCLANRTQFPSDEFERSLNALFLTDPADDVEMIEHSRGRLLKDSGSWLHDGSVFDDWLNCKRSRVLWLYGDPGKGKTMLAISVLRSISEKIKASGSGPSVLLAYFLCDNKDVRRNNSIAILRGLIYQLLHARPDLSSKFRELFSKEGDRLFNSPTALHSLWRILKDFIDSPSIHRVYIVIDALDEVDDESIDDVLKLLTPFLDRDHSGVRSSSRSNQTDNCQVKWFLTSRNVRSISGILSQASNISLEENSGNIRDAVARFIDMRVSHLSKEKGYNKRLTALVTSTLREISEGTFLYVSMACGALARPNVRLFDTDKVLRTFPKGLEALYKRMIRQIDTAADEDHVQYAKSILRAMVLARRPLQIQELAVIAGLPKEHHSDTSMLHEYVALCGSFVTQREDKVLFVHESVKQYLMSISEVLPKPISWYHAELTRLLIQIILDDGKANHNQGRTSASLAYPHLFWIDHGRQAEDQIDWSNYLTSALFRWGKRHHPKWLDVYWHAHHADWDKLPGNFRPLHLAAYGGVPGMVKTLAARGDSIDEPDSGGCTPLMWATKKGFPDVVESLLELGANHGICTPSGMTAVLWASQIGQYRSLEKLIKAGAEVRDTEMQGRTPLHCAAGYGNIKTLRVLIAAGGEIEAKDVGHHTPLIRASVEMELACAEELIKNNADVGVRDKEGRTLLHLAARMSDLKVLDFWLEKSHDLETVDDQFWTPLMHAALFNRGQAISNLIENGAKTEAKTKDGHTALSIAAFNGQVVAVTALLGGGANANNGCHAKESPLHQAAYLGHIEICRHLLEAGADANAISDATMTPLHQAAANGHEISAKLLLQYGADPNALCSTSQTPGARAEENGYHVLAKYLNNREVLGRSGEGPAGPSQKRKALDPAVCELLGISPECGYSEIHGKEGFSMPEKVTALVHGQMKYYFMKSGGNGDMFSSEHQALCELEQTVAKICPHSIGDGKYKNGPGYFMLMEWFDKVDREEANPRNASSVSLPQKLAKLHTAPAKAPPGHKDPMFGWHRPTYCGSTKQTNTFHASWAKFYSESRLMAMLQSIDESHGTDHELRAGVKSIAQIVVPRLLGNGHLGGRRGISPVLVHGDLWHGNQAYGANPAWKAPENLVFDPSACYAHSEYELGIMRIFGGFSAGFFDEYHQLVPKTEPIHEYEDRILLYKLYHYLNHYLIFRGAYKDNSMDIVKKLADKYINQ